MFARVCGEEENEEGVLMGMGVVGGGLKCSKIK